ncbi:MAG: carboxypeptidase-like regulatory domain-containing protein [Pirellulales bacterium]
MQSVTDKPTALRESWRSPDLSGPRGRARRFWRRYLIALLAAALFLLFAYLLLSPFAHPTTRLLESAGGPYDPFQAPLLEFVAEDAAAIKAPLERSFLVPGQTPLVHSQSLRTPDDVAKLIATLDGLPSTSADVVVIYLAAHGVAWDGEARLLCQNFTPAAPEQGSYPLAKLLRQLQLSPAGLKLLVLEHGRLDYDPRLGIVVNEFPRLLQAEVEQLRTSAGRPDPSVWVLSAHSPLERSHVDYVNRRSMFGGAVARALAGAADLDDDQLLTLDELTRFVRRDVQLSVQAATNGRQSQTPELLGPQGGDIVPPSRRMLLSVPPKALQLPPGALELAAQTSAGADALKKADAAQKQATDAKSKAEAKAAEAEAKAAKVKSAAGGDGKSADGGTAAEPTAENAAAPSGDATGAEAAASGAPSSAARPFPTRDAPLADAVAYGWEQSAQREANETPQGDVVVELPAWWRSWKERLVARERQQRFGDPADQPALALSLRQDLATLFAPAELAPRPTADLVARRLAEPGGIADVNPSSLPSIALAESIAQAGGPPLAEPLRTLLADLDRLLAGDDSKAFREWLKKPWPKEAESYWELQWLRDAADGPAAPWPLLGLGWRTIRAGQQTASDPYIGQPWAQQRLALADSWRRAGQREMAAQIGKHYAGRADASLREALRQYEALQRDLALWRSCDRLRLRSLARAADYVRWHQLAEQDPEISPAYADVVEFLDVLAAFSDELEKPQPVLVALLDQRQRLDALERRLREPLAQPRLERWLAQQDRPAEQAARIETLLKLPLLEPTTRELLLEAANAVGPRRDLIAASDVVAAADPDPRILTEASWSRPGEQLVLVHKLARLARLEATDDAGAWTSLESAFHESFDEAGRLKRGGAGSSPDPLQFWHAYRAYGSALRSYYDSLPSRLADAARRRMNLVDPQTRAAKVLAIRMLQRGECLLDSRDVTRLDDVSPSTLLRQAAWYDALRTGFDRALAEREDAPPLDVEAWAETARRFARAATNIPLQPPLPPLAERILEWDGPTSIALTTEPKRELTLTLNYRGRTASRAWIVLDYDPELLDVRPVGGFETYEETQLREKAPPGENPYPVRPDLWGRTPSFDVAAGQPQRLQIVVRRRPAPGSQTLVVVKVICGEQVARHEIRVQLPATDTIALVPLGPVDGWSASPDGVLLHPLANHPADYRFQLVNTGLTDREVSVQFLAANERIPGETPDEFLALSPDEILRRSKPGLPLMSMEKVLLAADGTPVTLLGPLPKKAGAQATPRNRTPFSVRLDGDRTNGGADEGDAKGDAGPAASAAPPASPPADLPAGDEKAAKPLGLDVRHGLLMVVRDLETAAVTVRRVLFRPQRPRRFLTAEADYDAEQERLTLRIRPRNPALVPDKGFLVKATFPVPLPPGTEAQLEGIISAPKYEAVLYAAIPAETDRLLTVHLDVDDYPRGLAWNLSCASTARQIPPSDDLLAIQITSPDVEKAYQAPVPTVPVEFQVDAPQGAFESPRDYVEVGVDRRRDRELSDDATVRVYSDRQVDVAMTEWTPEGNVRFVADVHDFRVVVPATGLRNVRSELLAQARVGLRTVWSEPVGVLFDANPPEVQQVELSTGRMLTQMEKVRVTVFASDDQRSGVGKVELAFDLDNSGEFGAGAIIPAKVDASGRWIADVPVDVPNLGPTRLLVRATDRVGNVSEFKKVPVVVVSPMEAEEAKKNLTNRVTGVVKFSKQLVPNAQVELRDDKKKVVADATTDEQGKFVFPKVPQGKYKLWAKGVSRNRAREVEMDVVVPPPPAQSVQLEVLLSK